MDDLLDNQRILAQRISRVSTNLRKKGKANLSAGIIRTAHSYVVQLWADYCSGDSEIRAAAKTDLKLRESPYFKEDEQGSTEMSYLEEAGIVSDLLAEYEAAANVKPSSDSNVTVVESSSTRSRAVLPKMSLPTFEDSYKDWPTFRDLFTFLIIKDPTLSPVERLHYLKSCMRGDAVSLLKNVQTTGENFAVAWEKLEQRYDNPRLLIQAQIRTLATLAPVRRESYVEMKRFYNETFDAIDALANLGRPVTNAVDWIVELTVERWDRQSRREWEDSLKHSKEPPTIEQLKTFMEGRINTCQALEAKPDESAEVKKAAPKSFKVHQVSKARPSGQACGLCQGKHFVMFCGRYQDKTPSERKEAARSLNLCYNCLGKHAASDCNSNKRCQKCDGKHHTTLHGACSSQESTSSAACVQQVSTHVSRVSSVLLSTARVTVSGPRGKDSLARALIDPGSEVSLISEALAQWLGVKRSQARIPLLGVGGAEAKFTRGKAILVITSHYGEETQFHVPVYVIPELSRYRPRNLPALAEWPHVQGLTLADPVYHLADPMDILLGADSYNRILREGVKRGPPHTPVAQETSLGWILTGGVESESGDGAASRAEYPLHHCNIDRELIEFLTRFWEQEEIDSTIPDTAHDRRAEEHFSETHRRLPDGRFMVRLPFDSTPGLGDSRRIAMRTLETTIAKFRRSSEFKRAYNEFLENYEALGHMAPMQHPRSSEGYYLPHHGVLREASSTTKLRVVFNGSMPSSNGKSLNDFLLRGPNLLPNLADVLLRWRRYRFVFSADIEKMYRQIVVHPEDRKWQRIVWKPEQESEIVDYELSTVTYGLACSPYLAIRCLHQLAKLEEPHYPLGSRIVLRDIYMDDVLAGGDTLSEARRKQQELRQLLMAGGFPLRQFEDSS